MLKRIRALLGGRGRKPAPEPSPSAVPSSEAGGSVSGPQTAAPGDPPAVHRGPPVVHRPIPESDLDPDAVKIIRRLTRFDHKAYLVGGCVRDLLLGRRPKDFDVGTSATPRQIKKLFRNCRIIGRRFRLAHIYFQDGKIIEVATFRALDGFDAEEGGGKDDILIRDDNVFGTAEEDALRRDFTINALFYDLTGQTVLDHADGLRDLRLKLVRTIGDPEIRFREDPIRCLRAIKFAARLSFTIEPGTLEALRRTRDQISKAAPPRVLEELNRFCRGGAARSSFELMRETGVLDEVLPVLSRRFRASETAWPGALALLHRMDRSRAGQPREIRTGEIMAVLLLPLLEESIGWSDDGTARLPKGLNLRETVDQLLGPAALELCMPRREQEYCRQILGTLARMVPAQRLRAGARRAIAARECLDDALWILEGLAEQYRGDFAESLAFWRTESREQARPAHPRKERGEARASQDGDGRRNRRRRSRRGGRRAPADAPAVTNRAAASGTPVRQRELPPPWDDGYFFAALPSAPATAADDDLGDRYGEAALTAPNGSPPPAKERAADAGAPPVDGARPRRRRRSRRRGRSRGARAEVREGQPDGEAADPEEDGADAERGADG